MKQLISLSCRYSSFGETTMLMLYWRQRRTVRRHTQGSCWILWLGGMPFSQKQWLVNPCKIGSHSLCSPSLGINRRSKGVFLCGDFSRWKLVLHLQTCASKQLVYAFLWPWNCCISHWRQRPQHHWGQFLCLLQDVFRTPREGNWWPDHIFRGYHVVCAISIMSKQWGHLIVFDIFFAKVLKKVQHCRVDVIAGDATAAAYRCYKRQSCQALYNSSVAVMLREMQREVDMNRPFQSRLLCDHSTNNHHSQLPSTDYPYCGFHVFSLMEKTAGTQNCEWTLEQHVWAYREWSKRKMLRTALISRVLKSCWERRLGRAIQIQRTLTILWLHHETIRSFRCWCFRTKIAGSDPCTYRGDFLFLWPFVSCFSEMYRGRSIANLEARDEARSRRLRKTKQSDQSHRDTIWQSHSYWQWDPLHGLSRQGHAWRGK